MTNEFVVLEVAAAAVVLVSFKRMMRAAARSGTEKVDGRRFAVPEDELDLDDQGLRMATRALAVRLGAEADEQRAYLHDFSDGRVSFELEWVDLTRLARAAVAGYVRALAEKTGPGPGSASEANA